MLKSDLYMYIILQYNFKNIEHSKLTNHRYVKETWFLADLIARHLEYFHL